MTILFAMASPEYLRFYDATIEAEGRKGTVTPEAPGVLVPVWQAVLSPLAAVARVAAARRRDTARARKVEQAFRDKDAAVEDAR